MTPRAALDAAAPALLEANNVPSVAVGWIENGQVAWTAVYGERAPGERADDTTLYNIASLTKPIVAETILRLIASGRLDLDTPLATQFVDRDLTDDPRAQKITLRHALSHRTGVPQNWRRQMDDGKLQLAWEPGTKAHYSGENYAMAARFAMMATQTRLDHLAQQELFGPFGMTDTFFTPDDSWDGRVAMVRGEDGSLRLPDNSPQGSAADDVHTTIGDYTRFVAAAMRGDGLTPELIEARGTIYDDQTEMVCPPGLIPPDKCAKANGYGLGWNIFDSGSNRFFIHSGKDWGERTIAVFEPEKRFGIVIFTSGANGRQVIADVLRLLVDDVPLYTLVQAEADFEKRQR
ncbi:serine hydrolase domain-containing protein [Sphingosinithalassobacter portus]|uniref:serine hydrolase domain-containing protein n=1 Tax=Stakelama portus TaxID=2676234 RepID=UPI001379EA63|nr:serine hydrolase domain-containing protein [Sphingosinithalassobacter portus]